VPKFHDSTDVIVAKITELSARSQIDPLGTVPKLLALKARLPPDDLSISGQIDRQAAVCYAFAHHFSEAAQHAHAALSFHIDSGLRFTHELCHRALFALADIYHHAMRHLDPGDSARLQLYVVGVRLARRCEAIRRTCGTATQLNQAKELVSMFEKDFKAKRALCSSGGKASIESARSVARVLVRNVCCNATCEAIESSTQRFATCAGCHAAQYCSADCQKEDWKAAHKLECTKSQAQKKKT
jgi:hypothetical protein